MQAPCPPLPPLLACCAPRPPPLFSVASNCSAHAHSFLTTPNPNHACQADPRLLAALDLMRRMPPSRMESSLEGAPLHLAPPAAHMSRAAHMPRARAPHSCVAPPLVTSCHPAMLHRAGRPRAGPDRRPAEHGRPAPAAGQGCKGECLLALRLQPRWRLVQVSLRADVPLP